MQFNGVIGNLEKMEKSEQDGREIDFAPVDWFDTEKAILRLTTEGGRGIGIRQPGGERLRDGDILYRDEKLILAVRVKPSKLLRVNFRDAGSAARVCYELGNRHLPVFIEENRVTVPYDEPTELYLKSLGFAPVCFEDVFAGSLVKHHHAHD